MLDRDAAVRPIVARPADNHMSPAVAEARFGELMVRSGGMCEGRTPHCLAPGGRIEGVLGRRQVSIQHRRAQGSGGTSLEETNRIGNHLLLCGDGVTGCHGWTEVAERAAARDLGLWVPHVYAEGRPVPVWWFPFRAGGGAWRLLDPDLPLYRPVPAHLRYATSMDPVVEYAQHERL